MKMALSNTTSKTKHNVDVQAMHGSSSEEWEVLEAKDAERNTPSSSKNNSERNSPEVEVEVEVLVGDKQEVVAVRETLTESDILLNKNQKNNYEKNIYKKEAWDNEGDALMRDVYLTGSSDSADANTSERSLYGVVDDPIHDFEPPHAVTPNRPQSVSAKPQPQGLNTASPNPTSHKSTSVPSPTTVAKSSPETTLIQNESRPDQQLERKRSSITEMGFSEDDATRALSLCGGDIERSVEMILMGFPNEEDSSSANTNATNTQTTSYTSSNSNINSSSSSSSSSNNIIWSGNCNQNNNSSSDISALELAAATPPSLPRRAVSAPVSSSLPSSKSSILSSPRNERRTLSSSLTLNPGEASSLRQKMIAEEETCRQPRILPPPPPPSGKQTRLFSTSAENVARKVVNCGMSQYDIVDGSGGGAAKSACTCMALYAGYWFLKQWAEQSQQQRSQAASDPCLIVTSEYLQTTLLEGAQLYHACHSLSSSQNPSSVEQFSTEEAWNLLSVLDSPHSSIAQNLEWFGGVRQGVLGGDASLNVMGVLKGVEEDAAAFFLAEDEDGGNESGKYVACVMTKTPETVLVLLPLTSPLQTSGQAQALPYILVDTHPRPHVQNNEGAYATLHTSLDGLVQELNVVFPKTNLPGDVGEMVVMMYNSFDVYPFRWMGRSGP